MTRDEILAEYRTMASTGLQFQGNTVLQYEAALRKLCMRHRPRTLLDYGAGHGKAWSGGLRLRLGLDAVTKYDPAIAAVAVKPEGRFDAVCCVDVLEHVLLEDVDAVIADLFRYADKFVFVTTCPRPAKKFFADGITNLHVTQRPAVWWTAKLHAANANGIEFLHKETP